MASDIEERLNADMTQADLVVSWSSQYGVYASSVAVDDTGSMYVVGSFSGNRLNVTGSIYRPYNGGGSASEWNNYLIKFNSAGTVDWVNVRTTGTHAVGSIPIFICLTIFSANNMQIMDTDSSSKFMVGDHSGSIRILSLSFEHYHSVLPHPRRLSSQNFTWHPIVFSSAPCLRHRRR